MDIVRTDVPSIEKCKDCANGKEVVIFVERHGDVRVYAPSSEPFRDVFMSDCVEGLRTQLTWIVNYEL